MLPGVRWLMGGGHFSGRLGAWVSAQDCEIICACKCLGRDKVIPEGGFWRHHVSQGGM